MHLGVGHGAALEPAVEHLGNATHQALAGGGREAQLIDILAVEVGHPHAGFLGQLLNTANTHDFAPVLALPDRQRRSPIPVAADGPVAGVFQPIGEAAVAQMLGHPGRQLIIGHQSVAEGFNTDKPGIHRPINERGVAPPAVGVAVGDRALVDELFVALEMGNDRRVGLFDLQAGEVGDLRGELPVVVNRIDQIDAGLLTGVEIVFAKGRSDVDDAGAVFGGDIVGRNDAEGVLFFQLGKIRKQRLIAPADQLPALVALDNCAGVGLGKIRGEPSLGHDVVGAVLMVSDLDVVDVRANRQGQIAGQGPRRGGPGDKRGALLPVGRKADGDRRILDIFVIEVGLKVRQNRPQTGRERHDLIALVDEVLVPHLPERPPYRFHEGQVHGPVVVTEIDPATGPTHGLFPLLGIAQHNLAALGVEVGQPKALDLALAVQVQGLLNFHFDRQAVAVPAKATVHIAATHGPEARNDIFDRSGQQMAVVRQAGGERRAVVKNERLPVPSFFQRLFKNLVVVPELQDFQLDLGELDILSNRFHRGVFLTSLKTKRIAQTIDGNRRRSHTAWENV